MSEIEVAGSWPQVISQLLAGKDLSASHAGAAMRSVLSGEATPSQITAFIVALRAKGETEIELEGMLTEVRRSAERVFLQDDIASQALDLVRSGGDHLPPLHNQRRPSLRPDLTRYDARNSRGNGGHTPAKVRITLSVDTARPRIHTLVECQQT